MTDLGTRLAGARKRLGWSLRAAERASGVHNAHISQIETGAIAQPGFAVVARLAKAYGLEEPTMTLPPAAFTAAWDAFHETVMHGENPLPTAALKAALEVAAPLIAAAERERCARLAEQHNVTWLEPCDDPGCARTLHTHHRRPFAGKLREMP